MAVRGAARAVAAVATLAAAGCASLPPCPARGGPAWSDLRTEHFELLTDLDPADAQAALRGFEELRAAVRLAAWRRAPEPRGRIVVFVLRDSAERRVFVPPRALGTFVYSLPLSQSFIVKSGDDRDDTVTQGLVFALAHRYGLQGKARWFDVGLAEYLGTLAIDDDGKVSYGKIDPLWVRALSRGAFTSFENLWQTPDPSAEGHFRATSWLLVHYLFNHEGLRFERFQRALIETGDARLAWADVFPDLTNDEVDARLHRYVFEGGSYASFETQLPVVRYESTVAPVPDARVHALRALLYETAAVVSPEKKSALVRAEVAEALRLDALEAVAMYLQRLSLHDHEDDLTAPRALLAREPNNALAWLVLAHAHAVRGETAEAAEAVRRLRALAEPEVPVGLDLPIAQPG